MLEALFPDKIWLYKKMEVLAMQKGFFGSLFDFSFSDFITPKIISILFIIGVIGAGIGALVFIIGGFASDILMGVLFLILSPLYFLLMVIIIRVYLEIIIILFKIYENIKNLGEVKESTPDTPPAPPAG
ncbi:MAG TPA: DUF4282 domain-containing protein [Firmicutes bacterium]|nr:DUF4282 domain-containing protein [Bacillota bacterium]